jgi:hypothetical protein
MSKQKEQHLLDSDAVIEPDAPNIHNLFARRYPLQHVENSNNFSYINERSDSLMATGEGGNRGQFRNENNCAPKLSSRRDSYCPPTSHAHSLGAPPFHSSGWGYPTRGVTLNQNLFHEEWCKRHQQQLLFSQPTASMQDGMHDPQYRSSTSHPLPLPRHQPPHDDQAALSSSSRTNVPAVVSRKQTKQHHNCISREILDIAEQLNLPRGKFSHQNWKDTLTLMYRWKTTVDDTELQQFGSSTRSNGRAYNRIKSVNRFCDTVLMCKAKRRMFNDHWNDSGLKKIVEQNHEDDLPPYDSFWLQNLLDDYFSGRKRRTAYELAKKQALADRQQEINATWNGMTHGIPGLSIEHLSRLQTLIERPYSKKVEVVIDGNKTMHTVKIDGFCGQHVATGDANKREKSKEKALAYMNLITKNPTLVGETEDVHDGHRRRPSVPRQDKENTTSVRKRIGI